MNSMPSEETPPANALRAIQKQLASDVVPARNLGSFVTTQMEAEAEQVMIDAWNKNLINYESYPATTDMHTRCLNMIANLFHAPLQGSADAVGTSTVGSSEAILLAVLAMRKRWVAKRKGAGKDYSRPNLIMSSAVQVCWKKAARYFDIEERYIYCSKQRNTIDPQRAVDLVNENTIGICSILGTTYTGEYEDTKAINDLLVERELDVPIHVDAASGGFVAPFLHPDLVWDFQLEQVASINVSGHKYGLVYAGIGWAIWRSAEYLPQDLIFKHHYLGTEQSSFNLNFSRSASHVICQYYNLIRLGKHGYRRIMTQLADTAEYLTSNLEQTKCFEVMSGKAPGLPLVVFRLDPSQEYPFDEYALAEELLRNGWMVPAYTMAPHNEESKILRVVVRQDLSRLDCDALVATLRRAIHQLS
ncbi:pyridoxal phosphate-dependent transferase [Aspergillus karnatakaensis]|uniref:pyridoxal phosphate-dependent transferase n=1 Tax=Aspergillus karnatakaensis TaxID=1810916 RepID=UPI003CCDABCA